MRRELAELKERVEHSAATDGASQPDHSLQSVQTASIERASEPVPAVTSMPSLSGHESSIEQAAKSERAAKSGQTLKQEQAPQQLVQADQRGTVEQFDQMDKPAYPVEEVVVQQTRRGLKAKPAPKSKGVASPKQAAKPKRATRPEKQSQRSAKSAPKVQRPGTRKKRSGKRK
jgi:hypothetical protein